MGNQIGIARVVHHLGHALSELEVSVNLTQQLPPVA
jgi:hypothetical protein